MLIPKYSKTIEKERPTRSRICEGSLQAQNDSSNSMKQKSKDGECIGSDSWRSKFEQDLGKGTPEIVIREGDVFAFVLESFYLLLSFGSYVDHSQQF